jgi:ribosomal protein S21
MDENIVDELRKKQYYKKPSLKKRDEAKDRIRMRAKRRRLALSPRTPRTGMMHHAR